MSHLKRKSIEKSWPLPRKGTKYLLKQHPGKKAGLSMPLGIILRDVIKLTSTRKETKALLHDKEVSVDGKIRTEEKFPIGMLDIIGIKKLNKNFICSLNENRKISIEEINEKDAGMKICKIIGQTSLKKGIMQINCSDGRNFILKEKVNVNDSVAVDLKTGKIAKIIPMKSGTNVWIIGGAHAGEKGKISEIKAGKISVYIKNKNFEIQQKNLIGVN